MAIAPISDPWYDFSESDSLLLRLAITAIGQASSLTRVRCVWINRYINCKIILDVKDILLGGGRLKKENVSDKCGGCVFLYWAVKKHLYSHLAHIYLYSHLVQLVAIFRRGC